MADSLSRRHFLRTATLGLGAAAVLPACASRAGAEPAAATAPRPLAVQLYTVRELMQRDVAGTLAALAGIGYRQVEFAGYHGRSPREIRGILDRHGLTAPTAHVPLDAMAASMTKVLDDAQTVGHSVIIAPYTDAKTLDQWKRVVESLARHGEACRARGLRFAYHNHDFEFRPVEGQLPYDMILALDPALVALELDLFWATKAGRDPVTLFAAHPGRFVAVHVKDMKDLRGTQTMTEVGAGDIDFGRIFQQAPKAGVQYYVVEHDNPADPMASVRTSYGNLRRLLA